MTIISGARALVLEFCLTGVGILSHGTSRAVIVIFDVCASRVDNHVFDGFAWLGFGLTQQIFNQKRCPGDEAFACLWHAQSN